MPQQVPCPARMLWRSKHYGHAIIGTDALWTAMAIVSVKVWPKGKGTPVITYAFLDSSSSSTFCSEALIRQLGVNGPGTLIYLATLDRKNILTDSFILQELAIFDLDQNVFIKLPPLYTRPEIPISKEGIPNQVDVDKWPHLTGVYLPDVEAAVILIIASDVQQILDPLEVRHNCQDGGPYASGTIVGWVVNGPLGCRNQCSCIPSFCVKANHDLNQMVTDYYNGDFPESSADDKPEMSQVELRFLNVLNSTAVLKGHYEMALPFRDREVTVPNNWVQAERRALWLKQKLHDNNDLYTDYKVFMAEILEEGYARKVPAHTQGVNCRGAWRKALSDF